MSSGYTDEDTERVRETERSTAGHQTQPLGGAVVRVGRDMLGGRGGAVSLPGVALMVIGALMLIGYLFGATIDLTPGLILLTIGACFLFFAFWQRLYGLIIPGCILAGLSIGVPLASLTHGVSVLWGLSLAFLAIFVVGRGMFGVRVPWPVVPSVILFAVGCITAITNLPALLAAPFALLPLLLIALGLALGVRRGAQLSA